MSWIEAAVIGLIFCAFSVAIIILAGRVYRLERDCKELKGALDEWIYLNGRKRK